jgi:glycerol uptake facilitator-like aquaporin
VAEGLGTALLLAAVVGSGIMGDRLAGGNPAIALLANSLATGALLIALVMAFGPVSGAHFNPAVTVVQACGTFPWGDVPAYLVAQTVGAVTGVGVADLMFGEPVYAWSSRARGDAPGLLSEAVATFGLMGVVLACARRPAAAPFAVGAWITGAYWFTASTSFANPAATLARSLTDTFAGIRIADAPLFIAAQVLGAAAAAVTFRWLLADPGRGARSPSGARPGVADDLEMVP